MQKHCNHLRKFAPDITNPARAEKHHCCLFPFPLVPCLTELTFFSIFLLF